LRAEQRSKELLAVIEANTAHRANTTKRAGLPKLTPRHSAASKTAPRATGTGVLVTAQGHVLTAAHVVADATNLSVVTGQGTLPATVLRVDKANNVAVLKIDGGAGVPLPIAQSRQVRLGQTVATIGFPNVDIQGYSPKVNRGEISSLNGYADDPHTWQISVPVQLGNSGGPLVDENGNVIGVVISKLKLKAARAIGGLPQSVNYAVKSAYVLPLLEPYLGSEAPEPNQPKQKPSFEDMVAKAQQSVVLILSY
jgi:S1-C subfamily serine protease